ncbi:Anterior gradient protein 2 like protein [Pteropus alecto]|uniref:Anterior gradient protein 2 like protein n=1 Tax=Pteropus alecto TaxID=9402 RepID=L5KPJ2_PTEAL|nr:Anterior gradient protein 2 like protein [Pteropus alecto]
MQNQCGVSVLCQDLQKPSQEEWNETQDATEAAMTREKDLTQPLWDLCSLGFAGWGDDITWVQTYEEGLFHTRKRFAMEKISVSTFLLLVALSYTLAKDTTVKQGAKKDTRDSSPKLPQTLSRGWGDQLIWTQTYEEALYKSKTSNKPLMIIHHLDECPHSQALKKMFAENKEIQKLAEQFVLINLVLEPTSLEDTQIVSTLTNLLTQLYVSAKAIEHLYCADEHLYGAVLAAEAT